MALDDTAESCYPSGPMTGYPDLNFEAFHAAAGALRAAGLRIVNPAEFGLGPETPWVECLKRDLVELLNCTRVVVLPGWEESRGARLEVHVARELGFPVLTLQEALGEAVAASVRHRSGARTGGLAVR